MLTSVTKISDMIICNGNKIINVFNIALRPVLRGFCGCIQIFRTEPSTTRFPPFGRLDDKENGFCQFDYGTFIFRTIKPKQYIKDDGMKRPVIFYLSEVASSQDRFINKLGLAFLIPQFLRCFFEL